MLSELYIKNIVLIDELTISFKNCFTVFTGQTGAGKSILLDSLALALGDRADFNLIKNNASFAEVVAVFNINAPHEALKILHSNGFIVNDLQSHEIIIKRQLFKDGKSKAFINDTAVSVGFLKTIGDYILDIHGQGDNQLLLHSSRHRDILDKFLPNKTLLTKVSKSYNNYKQALENFNKHKSFLQDLQKEQEYLEFIYLELSVLNLKDKEEEDLVEKKALYSNIKKIFSYISSIQDSLEKGDLTKNINHAIKQSNNLLQINNNDTVNNMLNYLENAYSNVENAKTELDRFKSSFVVNEHEIDEIEERLILVRSMAKKYKMSVIELYGYIAIIKEKLNILEIADKENTLEEQLNKAKVEYLNNAEILHSERIITSKKLEVMVNNELSGLLLKDAELAIDVSKVETSAGYESGIDNVTFKIKTNKGSDFGPLQNVASGGEMARTMLALKMVFSKVDSITTIILDEIDIGVGGEVSLAIGKRLQELSKFKQVIVVTHSHQVASCGVEHFKVIKTDVNNVAVSAVIKLNAQQRIEEIARMLSGSSITANAIDVAKNMLAEHSIK